MDEKILTKEEYTEKLNNLLKPVIDFAMSTKQFNKDGHYAEEFVKVGDKEVTLMVVDSNWVLISNSMYVDLLGYRSKCRVLEKQYDKLMEEYVANKSKKLKDLLKIFR